MRRGAADELPSRAAVAAVDPLARKSHEPVAGGSGALCRHEVPLGGRWREAEEIGEPAGGYPSRAPESYRGVDVGRRHDSTARRERGADFPSQSEGEIGGVQQQQRPRGRRPGRRIGHTEILKDARSVPVTDASSARPDDGAARGRNHRRGIDSVDGDQPRP